MISLNTVKVRYKMCIESLNIFKTKMNLSRVTVTKENAITISVFVCKYLYMRVYSRHANIFIIKQMLKV